MIPKIVHYCWFGTNPISDLNKDCLASWEKEWAGYKIIKWDESNSPMGVDYLKDSYKKKKYGYLIDYVRLYALYEHGGIFLDLDFLAVKPIDQCLKHDLFFGLLDEEQIGMGIVGSIPGHKIINGLLRIYGSFSKWYDIPSTEIATNFIKKSGVEIEFKKDSKVAFYPSKYFYPYTLGDAYRGMDYHKFIESETLAIHLWENTWIMPEFRDFWFGRPCSGYKRAIQRIITNPNQGILYYKDLVYHTLRLIGVKK